jgi:hypothetical protein
VGSEMCIRDSGITLVEGSAAMEELKAGKFCHACHDRQPEMPEIWEMKAERLSDRIGERPSWANSTTMCCYCGARLGIEAEFEESTLKTVTPEQQKLLEEMFGKIRAD